MTDLRQAANQALEALEAITRSVQSDHQAEIAEDAITALHTALEQQAEPVADRAFLEQTLVAMEGVIDVADRNTDEFDALRACVVDLTLMLYTTLPQQQAEPLTDDAIEALHGIKETAK